MLTLEPFEVQLHFSINGKFLHCNEGVLVYDFCYFSKNNQLLTLFLHLPLEMCCHFVAKIIGNLK